MPETILDHPFDKEAIDARLEWWNEPAAWRVETAASRLVIYTGDSTDFWQRTHYGFRADNGHFLGLRVEGDFDIETSVSFHPQDQYDQAGLMVRYGPECWIKTSVEYEPEGSSHLGAVVTNFGFSDWSVQPFPADARDIVLRVRKRGEDAEVWCRRLPTEEWTLLRIAHLHQTVGQTPACGIYACSPKGRNFRAEFDYLTIRRPAK